MRILFIFLFFSFYRVELILKCRISFGIWFFFLFFTKTLLLENIIFFLIEMKCEYVFNSSFLYTFNL